VDRTDIGGYVVESVLGSGGSGTVYLARDGARLVALKVFETVSAPPLTLTHPNIVPVYAHGDTDDGRAWLAMQYVAGGDADAELRAGRMPPARAVHIVSDVACALDHAGGQGVVHGDVKPSNFLLANGDQVLLADFGVAPFARDGVVLTSAAYASPEMLRGNEVDGAADVYSLGCSLFRLLTGKPPFSDAGTKDEVVQAHLHSEPPQASRLAPWLPPVMDGVIAMAMAKQPDERFQSARALADAAADALLDGS
jgi:serine/threonine protein kinase